MLPEPRGNHIHQCLLTNVVPPTINFQQETDPEIDYNLNFTFNRAQERKVDVVLNTFGFGGHNACVVFASSPPNPSAEADSYRGGLNAVFVKRGFAVISGVNFKTIESLFCI